MSIQPSCLFLSVRIFLLLWVGLWAGGNVSLGAADTPRAVGTAEQAVRDLSPVVDLAVEKTLDGNPSGTQTFTLVATQVGEGTLEQNPSGTQIEAGTTVTLTAQPAEGWAFGGWSLNNDSIVSTSNPLVFNLESDTTVTAHFDKIYQWYTLKTGKVGRGTVTRQPDLSRYGEGTTVTVTAAATEGYEFTHWSGDVPPEAAADPVVTLTMDRNKAITANFELRYYVIYKLFLESSAFGSVSVSPDQLGFFAGTTVTLTATPEPGCRFIGWTGVPLSQATDNPLLLTMNSDKRIQPLFEPIVIPDTYALNLASEGNGTVAAQPALPAYPVGTTVTVTATPGRGISSPAGAGTPRRDTNWTTLFPDHDHDRVAHGAFRDRTACDAAPLSATTGDYSYKVETAWDTVTSATHYRLWRAAEGETDRVDLTGWQTATTFRDESVTPGVVYQYWVQAAADAAGFRASALTEPVAGWAAGAPAGQKVYRVTYRDCTIQPDTPTTSSLLFTGVGPKASIKIVWLNGVSPQCA
jgi:hypothetical protein